MHDSEKLESLCKKRNLSQTELAKLLSEDHTIVSRIEEMWKDGASAGKMAELFADAGIPVEESQIEDLLAELQKKKANSIGMEKVDGAQLKNIAGGGTGYSCTSTDDCDNHFQDPFYQGVQRCIFTNFCDELTIERCHVHSGTLFGLAK